MLRKVNVTVSVKISNDNMLFSGYSTHTDIIMASAYAYINAICKISSHKK